MKVFLATISVLIAITGYRKAFSRETDDFEKPPNVIIIMTDDQGYGEMSIHGNPILNTPNMDELHNQSIRLMDFHVAPMCTPTRGQLLTGMDAVRNGATNVSSGRTLLKKGVQTMANIFADAGYGTGIFGKWHLGDNYPYRPEDRGFEETLWFPSSHIGSVPDYWGNDYFDDVYIRNGKRERFDGYCTDVFFENAKEWIKNCKSKNKPFFAYIPTNAPHQPFHAIKEDIEAIAHIVAEKEPIGIDSSRRDDFIRYLAMIRNVDSNLGKLMRFLREEQLDQNTILIFLTDNGSTFGPAYYNAGMRGGKTQLYEGGHRVPCFIRWPIRKLGRPRDIHGLTQVQDIMPTLLALCNISHLANHIHFDGASLVPTLVDNQKIPEDRALFINYSRMPSYFDYPSPYSNAAIRKSGTGVLWKHWRLLNGNELYNLHKDPLQENNVYEDYPDTVAYLTQLLNVWWSGIEETANELESIPIGLSKEDTVLLSSCEWVDVFVDQQIQIESGVRKNSYWLIDVVEEGDYEFELRRWPKEINISLSESGHGEVALPIRSARVFIKNSEHTISNRSLITPGDRSVVFKCRLSKGETVLHTWFDDQDNEPISGAYYVYVTRK